MPENLQFDPFHQSKIGQEWRIEHRKIPRLPGSLDHNTAPTGNIDVGGECSPMKYEVSAPP